MELPKKFCHNCGKPTQVSAKFCGNCGTSLASIDETPPVPIQTQPRVKPQATFAPFAPRGEDDDDDEAIRADRVNSIRELGLSMSSLDVAIQVDKIGGETVGGLMKQGEAMPQGYVETPRRSAPVDNAAVLAQLQAEGGTLRK